MSDCERCIRKWQSADVIADRLIISHFVNDVAVKQNRQLVRYCRRSVDQPTGPDARAHTAQVNLVSSRCKNGNVETEKKWQERLNVQNTSVGRVSVLGTRINSIMLRFHAHTRYSRQATKTTIGRNYVYCFTKMGPNLSHPTAIK